MPTDGRPAALVLVVSGPSGAGKTTLCRRLLADDGRLGFSISCTTRAPRPGEQDGRDYYFLTPDDFERRLAAGEFLEHALVHGNRYGTLRGEVTRCHAQGQDILLDIDVQGAEQLRRNCAGEPWAAHLAYVFIGPPSLAELERRLRGRATDADEVIQRRLAMARTEMQHWRTYDYLIVNHELGSAYQDLQAVVRAERLRTARRWGANPWADL